MTKLIGFGRQIGKTTMAILESHATGKYIVSANSKMAKNTFYFAKQLGYTIPYPLTPIDFQQQRNNLIPGEGVIIDNVEMVLSALLNCPIDIITFNSNELRFAEDRYVEELTKLKKELNAYNKGEWYYLAIRGMEENKNG